MCSPLTPLPAANLPARGAELWSPAQNSRLAAGLKIAGVVTASRLEHPAVLTVSWGIAGLDALTGGLPRGALTEICGPASSGRSGLLLAALAEATRRQETCALVDATDSFDPPSAAAAGIDLGRLLWIRIGDFHAGAALQSSAAKAAAANQGLAAPLKLRPGKELEQALQVTDLLLQSSGFGMVAIDLADMPPEWTRRVPLASWFRFRRAVEHTPTVLLVVEQEPYAKTCAALVLRTAAVPVLCRSAPEAKYAPAHGQLLRGLEVQAELVRSRTENPKKPAGRVSGFKFQVAGLP